VKYPAKWGVQIAGMIFQTRSRAYGKIIPAVYVDLWELLSATAFGGLVSFWCILLLDGQLFIIGRE